MLGNDNNAPDIGTRSPRSDILGFVDAQISAQEVINRCSTNQAFNAECAKNEQALWTYFLQRDYPRWGVIGNPKEYYVRIAAVHGINLKNTTPIAGVSGSELLRRQLALSSQRPVLQLQIADTEPFPIADVVASTYSGALAQFLDNLQRYNATDKKQWIFRLIDEDLDVEHQTEQWPQLLRQVLFRLLSENQLDNTEIPLTVENELIAAFDLLQCQASLCDILTMTVINRLQELSTDIAQGNVVIEPAKLVRVEFGVAPGAVVNYFQTLSNLLFTNDAFTQQIIDYYRDLIRLIPGIKLSLLPRGYPFIKRQNLDKFDPRLFHVNPLAKPTVFPDYLNSKVFGEIDRSDPEFHMWRSEEEPYPIITAYPDQRTIEQRMEIVLPGILQTIQRLRRLMTVEFPRREAGFIVAGGMFSIIFDDYLSTSTNWLMKTDVDFFVYGQTHELRVKAFEIMMRVLIQDYPMGPSSRHIEAKHLIAVNGKPTMAYSVYKSVVTAQRYEYLDKDFKSVGFDVPNPQRAIDGEGAYRLDQYERSIAFQVINTNSKDGFEVIMNFDTSHIQVGYDCYDGWIATPYWELYYPRREALLVRYNIRGSRFTKTLYRGFTLKTLMPYALLLKMSGTDYASVIRPDRVISFKPQKHESAGKYPFPDDLRPPRAREFGHRAIVKPRIVTKDQEIIQTGDMIDLENPSRTVAFRVDQKSSTYRQIKTVLENLYDIFDEVHYDGQFKNGFDGYVNSAYLTFKIAPAPQQDSSQGYNKLSKFLLRDARILDDPRLMAVEFPDPGTEVFKWSIMTEVLVHSKTFMPVPGYYLTRDWQRKYNRPPQLALNAQGMIAPIVPATAPEPPPVLVIKTHGNRRRGFILNNTPPNRPVDEESKIYPVFTRNPDQSRALYDGDFLPRHNLSLVAKAVPNLDFPHPQVFRAVAPAGNDPEHGWRDPTSHKKEIIHQYFNFPVMIEGVVSFDTDEDFDNLDLHAPMLTDEARAKLPRLTYEQFNQVALGKLKLDFGRDGYQYLVTFPASVSESIFLDEADWTMPLDQALGDRDLRFNSICIFEYPILPQDDGQKRIVIEPGPGDEEFFANPPSVLKIFRSFKIIE